MPNRLIHEKSPYLLQHAHNPVDWFPWGEEAFAKARAEDKPIFLSIGYSTCHWCHVMEHESFEDEEVAELMNRAFVSIKVDREERPDIDHVYMTVAHMTTGRGGWPLNVLLTPDREPFLAGTYFPKSGGRGRPGMLELIPWVESVWRDKRSDVAHTTKTLKEHIARYEAETRNRARLSGDPGFELLDRAFGLFADRFDAQWGGFGTAPKFPSPHMFQFLLRVWKRTGSAKALEIVETSLARMRLGGLFDQIGGGFHRYSTDREWLLPHFEKMLYDQATQLFAYAEAHLSTGKPLYRETAEAVVEYVLRDMTGSEGAFFAAEDADSEGEEGKFYVFGHEELGEVLGADAEFAAVVFGVRPEGNFHDEATGELTGGNILHLKKTPDALAADFGLAPSAFAEKLAGIRERLFAYRAKRVRPHLDDKILVDWNGLFIAALAFAGRSFGREGWIQAAAKAFAAIRTRCVRADGTLHHRMKDGEAGIQAGLDDYAFLCLAAVELHQATLDPAYVEFAVSLAEILLARFRTEDGTGFHLTPDDGEALLFRPKDAFDGAAPSGNSIAVQCLLKLARIAGRADFAEAAEAAIRALVPSAEQNPLGLAAYLCAASAHLDGGYDVEVTAGQGERDLVFAASAGFAPGVLVFRRPTGPSFTPAPPAADGAAQARLCRDGRCEVETKKAEIVRKTLFNA